MTKNEILQTLKAVKPKYEAEGFVILGLFGSFARDEATESSDIDILYRLKNIDEYLQKYSGWNCINHIVETKEMLQDDLKKSVDFVDIETLNSVGKKYILKEVIYV